MGYENPKLRRNGRQKAKHCLPQESLKWKTKGDGTATIQQTFPKNIVDSCGVDDTWTKEDYLEVLAAKYNITYKISKIDNFAATTWTNELRKKIKKDFKVKAISMQVPMTFYDTTEYLENEI